MTSPITYYPTQDDICQVLRTALAALMPPGMPLRQGLQSRVSEPSEPDFMVYWLLQMPRLETNYNQYVDAVFTGSINGTTMDITLVHPDFVGQIVPGCQVFGIGVDPATRVVQWLSGTGGLGTYEVSVDQVIASEVLACGQEIMEQGAEVWMQIDVHGPNAVMNAAIVSTTFRDERGVELLGGSVSPIQPMWSEETQMPFQNAEQQWEYRMVITLHLHVNFTLSLPQDFMDQIQVNRNNVDAIFPP